ncbi:MAG: hypothetical protein ABH832_02290 [bacterium]
MSFKRKVEFQYRSVCRFFLSFRMPTWITCKAMRLFLLSIIIFFGSAYIIKTASSASGGYEMQKYEGHINSLQEEIKKIESSIAEESSMAIISKRLEGLDMVQVDKVVLLDSQVGSVAKR